MDRLIVVDTWFKDQPKESMMNGYVWTRAVFVAFSGFLYGYDLGAISGVKEMEGFRGTIGIPNERENGTDSLPCDDDVKSGALVGLTVSMVYIAAIGGALLSGALSDYAGRKIAIIVGALLYAVGGVLQAAAYSLWMVFLGRSIAGISIGIHFAVVPVYIAEISPKKLRGRLIAFFTVFIGVGILTGYIVNLVVQRATFGWRISLGIQTLAGLILATGMLFVPETPRWLVKKHKDQKAEKVLTKIHQSNEAIAQEELKDIQDSLERTEKSKESLWTVVQLLFSLKNFLRFLFGLIVLSYSAFVGTTIILIYSVTVFCKIGIPPFIAAVAHGVVFLLSMTGSIRLSDKFGRKALLLIGALGMMASMLAAGTLILVFRLEEEENTVAAVIVVVFIYSYHISYPGTYGSVPYIIASEIYPLKIRGIAVSIGIAVHWVATAIVTFSGSVLLASPLQTYGTFYVLAGIQFTAFVFVLFTLPETKGVSLEHMEALFSKPWLERTDILYYLRCGCFCRRKKVVVADERECSDADDANNPSSSTEVTKKPGGFRNPLFDNEEV